jgi:hypothetical protein
MKTMSHRGVCAALVGAFLSAVSAIAATNLPLNSPTTLSGVETVCTGIGEEAQRDARWAAYPLKIVFAGKGGQFVADVDVTVSKGGKDVVSVHCGGPWLLMRVPAGRYRITGVLDGQNAQANASVPATGQGRVILRFPNSGGATSTEHKTTP